MSLARRTGLGLLWAFGSYAGQRLLGLVTTVALARLLLPADIGIIAFTLLVAGLLDTSRDLGVKDALIYLTPPVDEAADTAFVMHTVLGLAQGVALFLLAPVIAPATSDPRTADVLRLLALTFPMNGLAATHDALLVRALEFRRCYSVDLVAALARMIVILALVFSGAGIWSMVAGQLVGSGLRLAGRWLLLSWRPRLRFVLAEARRLLRYSVHILAVRLLDMLIERTDQLLIAFLLGEVQLAFYYVAARIPDLVVTSFNRVLTQVLFPAYASIKDDRRRLLEAYGETTRYTAFAVFPAGLGLAAIAPEAVPLLFGGQWRASVPLVQVLALVAIAASLPWSAGDLFKALGRPDLSTKLALLESAYSFPLILIFGFASRQALWIAAAVLLSLCITAIVRLWVVRRLIQLPSRFYLEMFWPPAAAAIAMAVGVEAVRQAASPLPASATLAASVLAGIAIYGLVLFLLVPGDLRRLWDSRRLLRREA
jgi:lipopolysaccharide exporter